MQLPLVGETPIPGTKAAGLNEASSTSWKYNVHFGYWPNSIASNNQYALQGYQRPLGFDLHYFLLVRF